MRKDQLTRLRDLSERIAEFAISVADPDNWGLSTNIPSDMDNSDKLAAASTVKLASMSVGLLVRVEQVSTMRNPLFDGVNEPTLEGEIRAAENKAEALLNRVMEKHGKAKA